MRALVAPASLAEGDLPGGGEPAEIMAMAVIPRHRPARDGQGDEQDRECKRKRRPRGLQLDGDSI